jgi:hypothetical protein
MRKHDGSAAARPSLQWGVVALGIDRGDDAVARTAAGAFQHGRTVRAVRTLGLHLCSAWSAGAAEPDRGGACDEGALAFLGQGVAVLTRRRLLMVLTTGATPAGPFSQTDGRVLFAQLGLREVARATSEPSTFDPRASIVHLELGDGAAISLETTLASGAVLVAAVGSAVKPSPVRGTETPKS